MLFDKSPRFQAFDVESTSDVDHRYALQPYRLDRDEARLTSYAIAWWPDEGSKIASAGKECDGLERELLGRWLHDCIDNNKIIVGWNVAFDAAWLVAMGLRAEVQQARWMDGMLLWQHLTREPEYDTDRHKKRSYSLKNAVAQYLPKYAGYDDGVDFHDMSPQARAKRLKYNKMDAVFTLTLTRKFFNELAKQDPRQLRNAMIETATIPLVAQSMVDGLHVDLDAAKALERVLDERMDDLRGTFQSHTMGVVGEDIDKVLSSPKKLQDLLYGVWGLPVVNRTPKGAPSTDKVALHTLAAQDDRVKAVKDYREAKGNKTKFVDNVIASVEYNGDNCTRPSPRIYGTYTGRLTYNSNQGRNKDKVQTGFALHQMKRAPEFRSLIQAPPGFVVCEWDAAGQEYRWMAIESGDETMLSLCMPGEDPHGFMGSQIAHYDYREMLKLVHDKDKDAKNARQMGKVGNLSCVSGDTMVLTKYGYKLITQVSLDDEIWDGIEFVTHDGVVCNGEENVRVYQGLAATDDHLVSCGNSWVEFQYADENNLVIDSCARWSKFTRAPSNKPRVKVYDILNCGPRNRFVANGLVVHNCQYRISAAKLKVTANVNFDMPMTADEAEHVQQTYHASYPGVKQYWQRQINKCRRLGYAETIAGRRVQLNGSWTSRQTKWKQESTAVNFPIQGIGADQKYLAMKILGNYLPKFGGKFYFELHDGLYAILPEKDALQNALIIREALSNMPYKKAWGFEPPVPLPWDLKMGTSWGNMQEIEND